MATAPTHATAQAAIVYNALECEDALRLADFATREATLGAGMANSLHRLAEFHSAHAFDAARVLARAEATA